ncbi:MAG: type II toxin-antitoxin system VapC family toxin [Acidimicrobiales bacterium]|nr:type II toxin-antitoxin system VapC family toxin [Acidimicrobiales bacterium]
MILVDTNVLLYATGRPHQLALAASDALETGTGRMRITPRVLEEFAHAHARSGRTRADAYARCLEWCDVLGPLHHATEEDLSSALELWAERERLQFADALLAAQAISLDSFLLSADKAFAEVPGLRFLDLADPDLLDQLPAN